MAEVASEDDLMNITPKLASMNFLEKLILRIFTPLRKEIEQSVNKSLSDINLKNSQLEEKVNELSKALLELSKKVDRNGKKTDTLLADYNTKKASSESKYKAAIDILYKLNLKFSQNVPTFGRANKLEIIQMLVNYLYNPMDAIRETITSTAADDEKTLSILAGIDNFNANYKPDLIDYLSEINIKWEDCVLFPNEFTFNPSAMIPFNDLEIEEGTPVYVVSLGYKFPNSNSEKQLPMVFIRKTSN